MSIITDLEAEYKVLAKKYLDFNKDGHVNWDDAKYLFGVVEENAITILKVHAPEFLSLATAAVTTAAGLAGDQKASVLAGIKAGAIALGREIGADMVLTDAAAIGKMFSLPESMVNAALEALVNIGKKNQMVPSDAVKQAVGLDAASEIAPAQ